MDINVLKKKKIISINGEDFLDLSENVFLSDSIYDDIIGIEVINFENQMRIDLISLKWYGNTENIDIILKANNIFNPFILKEGDILIIPAKKQDTKLFKNKGTVNNQELRRNYIDKARLSENDINVLKNLVNKNKTRKAALKQPLPPNMLQDGVTNKKIDLNGNIILTNHQK